ncbi:MAG: extracellular solute-binding protein [Ruminococcaceae bacterium]|nr:extracellular solute-binding protein [Oscillospiraceae bacterium]
MKVQKKLRTCLFLLCLALLLPCAVGCNDAKTPQTTTPPNDGTLAPSEGDNLPERYMELFELTFLNYTEAAHGYSLKTICTEDVSEPINEAIYYRNLTVEDRYNAVILEQETDTMIDTLTKAVMANSGERFQIAMITDSKVNVAKVAGLLGSWNDMTYCDFSRDWWNQDAANCFSLNGDQYGAVGDFSLSMHSKNYCYFFNKKLYSTIEDAEDLYGLVRDGKWTVEKMLEIGELYTADLDGDGLWFDGTDQYGVAGTSKVNYQMILTGAGMRLVEQDANGVPYFALNSAGNVDRISNIIELFSNTTGYYNNNYASPNGGINSTEFLEGRVLLLASTVWNMTDYKNYDIHYGVLPAPKLTEEQAQYYSISVGGEVACVARSIKPEEIENVSILIEAMSSLSSTNLVPVYKENTLKSRYSNAPEDAEMLQMIFDTTIFDLGTSVWEIDIRRPIMENLFNELNSGVASYLQSLAPKAENAINQSMNAE